MIVVVWPTCSAVSSASQYSCETTPSGLSVGGNSSTRPKLICTPPLPTSETAKPSTGKALAPLTPAGIASSNQTCSRTAPSRRSMNTYGAFVALDRVATRARGT